MVIALDKTNILRSMSISEKPQAVKTSLAMGSRMMDPVRKIYIGGLPNNANKYDIEDAVSKIGRVTEVWVAQRPPGFAFVEMEKKRDAEDACRELNGTRICGNRFGLLLLRSYRQLWKQGGGEDVQGRG